jgi:protein tyrosine/serine phosphatase
VSAEERQRVVPLQGGRNFRDLGGYPAADGRRVKWGAIFRSGSLVGGAICGTYVPQAVVVKPIH